ncbi:MAG: DUF2971 domain-containing protein [Phycisphaerales bacterium]|nr:DUF2971 domain-containing protein [Phycisphaerales bacterium]
MDNQDQDKNGFDLGDLASHKDSVIWRYLEPLKLASMVLNSSLYCHRINLLEDAFEGTVPDKVAEYLTYLYPYAPDVVPAEKQLESLRRRLGYINATTYVNSWCMREDEDVLLWRMYAENGFAIRSTVGELVESLRTEHEYDVLLTALRVKYVDMKNVNAETVKHFIDSEGLGSACFVKHVAYQNENEIRLLAHCDCCSSDSSFVPGNYEGFQPSCVQIPVDTRVLIKDVVASPRIPQWQTDTMGNFLQRLGLDCTIRQSDCIVR